MEIENTIVLKIKKLLELANSSNKNEAEIASIKAQELLIKYNLNMQTVNNLEIDYTEDVLSELNRQPTEVAYITMILRNYFFVGALTERKFKEATTSLRIFGTTSNVQIATYVYVFLLRTYRQLWKEHKKQTSNANSKSFYYGITTALSQKLEATKKKVENEYGLIVVDDKKVLDWMSVAKKRTIKCHSNNSSFYDGYQKGQSIEIRKPINTNRKNSGGYLPMM